MTTTTMEKAHVTLPSDHEVRVSRAFRAPRALVYKAHTVPAMVKRWMLGPPGWTMPVCEMDVRVGGKYQWRWKSNEDGKMFGFHGEFREVVADRRIVHTEFFDPGDIGGDMGNGALITTEFTESGGLTTVTSVMDFYTKEARDAAMATGMTGGMEQSFQQLDALLDQDQGR
jgi:uncharacterized protein YndB with AHSA1/START domain